MDLFISVETTLNNTVYLNIVSDHVHLFMAIMILYRDGHVLQENEHCHRALSALNWFEEHQSEFNLFPWLAQSHDLSFIEHWWDEVEITLQNLETLPSNLTQLTTAIMSTWTNILQQ